MANTIANRMAAANISRKFSMAQAPAAGRGRMSDRSHRHFTNRPRLTSNPAMTMVEHVSRATPNVARTGMDHPWQTDTLRIGIIGAGANTRSRHIPGLRMQNSVEIVGVANRSAASSQKVAKELDIPKAYDDWTEIIADKTIDAVCIGTWPYMHAEMTIAALDAGKHVLCEARMAMNAREAHAMLAASRRNPSRTAQIVPAPMTLPVDRTIADTIASGAIGNVIAMNLCVSMGDYPNPDLPLHWRQNRDFSGHNIMALGIWYEQMARWVGHASSAFAVGQVVVKHRRDEGGARLSITIPDHVDVTGQLQQGGQYRLLLSSGTRSRAEQDRSLDIRRQRHVGLHHVERRRDLPAAR